MNETEQHPKRSKLPVALYVLGILILCFCILLLATSPHVPLSEDADPAMTKLFIQLAEEGKMDIPEPWFGSSTVETESEDIRYRARVLSAELARGVRNELQERHKVGMKKTIPLTLIGLACITVAFMQSRRG